MSVPDTTPDSPRPPAREAGLIVAVLVAVVAGLLWWSYSAPGLSGRVTASYVGDAACRDCHPGQSASHVRSGHSQTLRRASDSPLAAKLNGVTVDDPEQPGVTWSYVFRDGRLTTERREAGEIERFVVDYAFGSGHHATTFVSLTDRDPDHPKMIEHRLTVFAHKDLPDVTPAQSLRNPAEGTTPSGRHYSSWNTLKCFECHTTANSDRGTPRLDPATMIPNVGCERCHGPGRDHVAAARGGASGNRLAMPLGPGRASASEQMTACGQCHRLPEMVTGAGVAITPENAMLVRHQPVGLMQSACYTRSNGALSCTTCHDPHARTSTDIAAYETVCLSCHEGASKTRCSVSPKTGCVGCHMPRRDVGRGMLMSDHWIRSRPLPDITKSETAR